MSKNVQIIMRNGQKCGITRNGLLFLQNMTAICQVHNAATHTCHAKTQKIKFQDATKCIVMYCIVISTRAMCVCICTYVFVQLCAFVFFVKSTTINWQMSHFQMLPPCVENSPPIGHQLVSFHQFSTHWSSIGQLSSSSSSS